jgi:hypothetical protein
MEDLGLESSELETRRLQRHQIFSLVFVSLLGVVVIGLSVWEFSSIIGLETATTGNSGQVASAETTEVTDAELKAKDTDGDGLSDYDELKVYDTSPYLKDSDSDGFDDKTEIDSGNDPTCPKGQICFKETQKDTNALEGLIPNAGGETVDLSALAGATPDQIRKALVATGAFTEADLAKVGDEALMQIYNEALNAGGVTSSTGASTSTGAMVPSNIEELKATLKKAGLSDDLLSGIDDATLMQLYQDALKQTSGK